MHLTCSTCKTWRNLKYCLLFYDPTEFLNFVITCLFAFSAFPSKAKMTVIRQPKLYRHNYVHVCMAFDENDIIGAIAAINSIQKNTHHPVYFHLVTDSNTEATLRYLLLTNRLLHVIFDSVV